MELFLDTINYFASQHRIVNPSYLSGTFRKFARFIDACSEMYDKSLDITKMINELELIGIKASME